MALFDGEDDALALQSIADPYVRYELRALIMCMMSLDPKARPDDMNAVSMELQRITNIANDGVLARAWRRLRDRF